MENYVLINKIGEGSYGIVYKGKNNCTGKFVAIKKLNLYEEDDGIPSTAIRESAILQTLKHPNIVVLEDVFMEAFCLYLIFEFVHMDLKQQLDSLGLDKFLGSSTVKSYLYQINSAILFCHEHFVFHRDLKPQNLLIGRTGIVKIADFGLSRIFTAIVKSYSLEVVTLWYKAPELLMGTTQYTSAIDLSAMGCIFAEMSSKNVLFEGNSEINQLSRICSLLNVPTEDIGHRVLGLSDYTPTFLNSNNINFNSHVPNLDDTGVDLLQKMLAYDPTKRITAKNVQHHPYFDDVQLPRGLLPRQ